MSGYAAISADSIRRKRGERASACFVEAAGARAARVDVLHLAISFCGDFGGSRVGEQAADFIFGRGAVCASSVRSRRCRSVTLPVRNSCEIYGTTNAIADRMHCPPDEIHPTPDRINARRGRIHSIADRIHATRDRMHATSSRMHCPPDEIHACAERMNTTARRLNATGDRMNAIARHLPPSPGTRDRRA
ncbi:MAG TPA: hypothetical protein VJ901_12435 [Thermoanaerobaculia bacterium]|nr:hypothetical protein [Thermoanaerobaculia bacterium]